MKKCNKVLALLLTGAMLVGSLSGCGNQTENKETSVSVSTSETNKASEPAAETPSEPEKAAVTYPMDTDIELDVYLAGLAACNSVYANHNESYWHSKIADQTGIFVNFMPRITDTAAELMYFSNEAEAPDILCTNQRKIVYARFRRSRGCREGASWFPDRSSWFFFSSTGRGCYDQQVRRCPQGSYRYS